jgi:hypothetical protein
MISHRYVWLVWSSAFLVPRLAVYVAFPRQRKEMVWASAFTAPLGLTEPLVGSWRARFAPGSNV